MQDGNTTRGGQPWGRAAQDEQDWAGDQRAPKGKRLGSGGAEAGTARRHGGQAAADGRRQAAAGDRRQAAAGDRPVAGGGTSARCAAGSMGTEPRAHRPSQ